VKRVDRGSFHVITVYVKKVSPEAALEFIDVLACLKEI
jgi:hypothetical protein